MKKLITLALLLVCSSAIAAPVKWTFQNVVFNDGGTMTGSFTWDADTYQFSDINI